MRGCTGWSATAATCSARPRRCSTRRRAQPYRVAAVLLDLLGAADRPVLVAVEDAYWLDPPSWEALTFAARRLESDRVAMVLTARDGEDIDRRIELAGLPDLRLEALVAADSAALLDRTAPGLRRRVAGPGARPSRPATRSGLVELGRSRPAPGGAALLPSWLPLSTRVERTFAALVAELPAATRTLLLVAALDDRDDLDEMLAAGGPAGDGAGRPADVEPAVAARLIELDDRSRLRFRHPLLRSALRQTASRRAAPAGARRAGPGGHRRPRPAGLAPGGRRRRAGRGSWPGS